MTSNYNCEYGRRCCEYSNESIKCSFVYKFCSIRKNFQEEDENIRKGARDLALKIEAEHLRRLAGQDKKEGWK